ELRVLAARVGPVAGVQDVVPAAGHPPQRVVEQRERVPVDGGGRYPAVVALVVGEVRQDVARGGRRVVVRQVERACRDGQVAHVRVPVTLGAVVQDELPVQRRRE